MSSTHELIPIVRQEEPCLRGGPHGQDQASPKQPTWYNRILFGWWTLELISMSAALGLFVGLCLVLGSFDNKSITSWPDNPFFTTLQSCVHFISTGIRITMLVPVAAAIGQLKWHHIRNPRPVTELHSYDSASRGIFGSAVLLFSRNIRCVCHILCTYDPKSEHNLLMSHPPTNLDVYFRKPVALGCVIVIGSLFLGTFIQNTVVVLSSDKFLGKGADAKLPIAYTFNTINPLSSKTHPEQSGTTTAMLASIMYGWSYYEDVDREALSLSPSQVYVPFPVNCSTSHCTWGPVNTLSVGSKCIPMNWADHDETIISLPKKTAYNMTSQNNIPRSSVNLKDSALPTLLYIAAAGYVNDTTPEAEIEAVECIMYWKVQRYSKTSLTGHIWSETREKMSIQTLSPDRDGDIIMITESSRDCPNSDNANCPRNFTVTKEANSGLQNTLQNMFNGSMIEQPGNDDDDNDLTPDDHYTELLWQTWIQMKERHEKPLNYTMNAYIINIAVSIRNSIRSQSDQAYWASGTVISHEPYFAFRKKYLLYPGCMLALSLFFVLATIIWTRESQPWKNSVYPYIYANDVQGPKINKNGAPQGLAMMDLAAGDDLINLKDHHDGQGTVLRQME
ncbi:hypothetical protein QQS21_010002 [Conoideocrella luteorostrata]|uniref:Uncharacterized protein n=1 Tax=Conoideocrella luteorostrata TaxID=1105319 RepID=A0AAJ0CIK3_9HYPO|nr:hypothetical protein QQS21_010002 [Conoideocrella luteorostrata]